MSSRKPPKNRVVKINPLDGQARWVLSRFTPGKARGWDSSARSFPTSAFWREKASLPPFQRSLRSLPPLLGLRPATKRAFPLGTPVLCCRKSPNSLRLILRSSLPSVEKPCPLSLRRAFSPNTLAPSPRGLWGGLSATHLLSFYLAFVLVESRRPMFVLGKVGLRR